MKLALIILFSPFVWCQDSFETKLQQASESLIGAKYLRSPLGEAHGFDKDPLIRYDAFDCTTYVETVIAIAQAKTVEDHLINLTKIRYSGAQIDYSKRRHLPVFQWLPELIEQGVLQDITESIGESKTRYVSKHLSKNIWQQNPIVQNLKAESIPEISINLPYLLVNDLQKNINKVKQTSVLSIIKQPRNNVPNIIIHQALLIPNKNTFIVRHARSGKIKKVIQEPFDDFIKRLKRRNILGVNITDILPRLD